MSKLKESNKRIENAVVSTYQKIEDTVVGEYKKVEDTVVGSYKKIEDKFVDIFLDGEKPKGKNKNK